MPEHEEARQLIERLPDTYNKSPGGRLFRLFRIIGAELAEVRATLARTEKYRDIDQATGRTLDYIGSNVQQPRGQIADEPYRALIKTKIARNLSRGDTNSVKRIIAAMLSIDPSGVELHPGWREQLPEPAAITILSAPLDAIARFGLGPEDFAAIAERVVAAGVRVGVLLQGTFEFDTVPPLLPVALVPFAAIHDPVLDDQSMVDSQWLVDGDAEFDENTGLEYFLHVLLGIDIYQHGPTQYDEERGWADEAQAIGGTLGAFYDSPTPDLPID